jgi:hypothetical protein
MGLKPERPYCTRRRHHHLIAAPINLDPKGPHTSKKSLLRDCALRRFVPSSKKPDCTQDPQTDMNTAPALRFLQPVSSLL